MKKRGSKEKRGFVWYALRAGFFTMIASFALYYITSPKTMWDIEDKSVGIYAFKIFFYLFLISMLFTFIASIIHLKKYKEKIFAIISLVLSGGPFLICLWAIIEGLIRLFLSE
jgi:hypothetical protein